MNNSQIIDNETGVRVVTVQELEGVRTARFMSFLVDYVIIGILCIPLAIVIGFLGIITLSLGWMLYPFLIPAVALIYVALTLGGPAQATIGMRFMGVSIKRLDGGRVDPFLAVLHSILFWVIHSFAMIIPLFASFFSSKKRLIHDVLLGTYISRD